MNYVVFDIDGTLADPSHRLKYIKMRPGSLVKVRDTQGPWYTVASLSLSKMDAMVEGDDGSRKIFDVRDLTMKKDWNRFFAEQENDAPHRDMIELLWHLEDEGYYIQFASGRPDDGRVETAAWLYKHVHIDPSIDQLLMRKSGDFRDDSIVKSEFADILLERYRKPPFMVFDDRSRVVDAWRKKGFRTLQVAPGDF